MREKKKNHNPIYKLQYSHFWLKSGLRTYFYKAFKSFFFFFQKLGFQIVPNHYYSPIPDTRTLNDKIFLKHSKLIGIEVNENEQLKLLLNFESKYKNEYSKFPRDKPRFPYQYYTNNGLFLSGDGEILYCMIRHFKPKKIIEIGAGYSTFCSAQAILKNKAENKNYDCELIAIEPFPKEVFKKGFPGFSKLIPHNLQVVPISLFKELNENDMIFIDSSHVLKIGSDVKYEYLEILPRLNKGVLIHIHDILLPVEYPREFAFDLLRFWNEQYLLQAFLIFNNHYKILWMGKFMHIKYQKILEKAFNSLKKDRMKLEQEYPYTLKKRSHSIPASYPCSFWMKKIR